MKIGLFNKLIILKSTKKPVITRVTGDNELWEKSGELTQKKD
jgi:hypothetical protein